MFEKYYWIRKTHLFRRDEYICSYCKFATDKPHKHCPKCGVNIRKVVYDANRVNEMVDYDDIINEMHSIADVEAFKYGFRLATALLIETTA